MVEGFTKRYWVRFLVYYEFHPSAAEAIAREKLLKRWKRQRKIELIESRNPNWRDLWAEIAVP